MLRKWTMDNKLDLMDKLIQEHFVFEQTISRVADLAEDLSLLAEIKDFSSDFTPHQYNFVNRRRVDLRQHIVNLQGRIEKHYRLEDKVFQPVLGDQVNQALKTQQKALLKKLSEADELFLNLSPAGILLNGPYLQQKINTLHQHICHLNTWEGSLLELVGIYSRPN